MSKPRPLAQVCALLTAAALAHAAPPNDDFIIAEDGQSRAIIVVAADASEAEKYAADEVTSHLGQVCGARFTQTDPTDPAAKAGGTWRILVGRGAAALAEPPVDVEGLGEEGFIIRTTGRDLVISGAQPRGTLYAAYTFLEDTVGCRWWTPRATTIPHRPSLKFDKLDARYVPPLEYRESFWFEALDGAWAARNKCNGHSDRLNAAQGGKHTYEGFVHTFYPLIPPDKYFKEHPEWFSLIGGKRSTENAQLCLTNESLRQELVKNLKERLRANPAATIASVSQNDCFNNCQCEACAAIDKEEGSPAGSLLRFVNAVAADVEAEFPHVAIDTLAYQYTRKPPAKVRPRPNVIVRLCSIECSFSKPLADDRNQAFRDDLLNWSKICNRLYIWDYTTNFAHYVMPHPNLRVLGPNVRFFAEHGVKGVFEQGAYQSFGSEMADLRGWVLAKLLWDPTRDAQKLIDEFLDGYYGPAAPHIRAYLKLTHDAVDAAADPLGCYSPPNAKFLSLSTLCTGLKHFQSAEAAAGSDEELLQRVRVARLPLLYVFIVRWNELRKQASDARAEWPLAGNIREVYDEFMRVAQAEKITMVAEGRGIDWLRAVVEQAEKQPAAP
ncbi:MAG: hypothetical protein CHACPFDD_00267 [Phycisphaerae bacterium]|nr:hypothetical protein [Phycisphaerae bacterium]